MRATRGFNKGMHAWQVNVQQCSDYSYVGFVDDTWNNFANAVGKSIGSWGTVDSMCKRTTWTWTLVRV